MLHQHYSFVSFLLDILDQRRKNNLLGSKIMGKTDFNFDIRIQMGAGAYICGEETSLISSCWYSSRSDFNSQPVSCWEGL